MKEELQPLPDRVGKNLGRQVGACNPLVDLAEGRVGMDRGGQGGELHLAVQDGDPLIQEFAGMGAQDPNPDGIFIFVEEQLDLSRSIPFCKAPVVVLKRIFPPRSNWGFHLTALNYF